jgi:hypothetical protein
MKALALAALLVLSLPATAADVTALRSSHRAMPAYRAAPVDPLPMALRTLSRRSAAVMASMPCWSDCTATCGANFQACLRADWPKRCFALNDACDLTCLKACRLIGGPLVSWTDY